MKTHIFTRAIIVCAGALLVGMLYSVWTVHAEETETAGNCLSYPVIWPEGEGGAFPGAFRGAPDVLTLDGDCTLIGDVNWYHQQDENNEWQADSAAITGPIYVGMIDWGDDLEARDWTATSIVRVEIVLYKGPDTSATYSYAAYAMQYLFGEGPDEMYGANGDTYTVDQNHADGPTVYSSLAHLTIQKLPDGVGPLVWNAEELYWETADGQVAGEAICNESCSAEVNVKGMVIYGYNWWVRDIPDAAGSYRLTFSFEGETGVSFANAVIMGGTETSAVTQAKGSKGPPSGGGAAHISYGDNVTYIDVVIVDAKTGGGGNGGKGGHGGGRPKGPRP